MGKTNISHWKWSNAYSWGTSVGVSYVQDLSVVTPPTSMAICVKCIKLYILTPVLIYLKYI